MPSTLRAAQSCSRVASSIRDDYLRFAPGKKVVKNGTGRAGYAFFTPDEGFSMKSPITAIVETMRRARTMPGNEAVSGKRPPAPTIAQIIAALDDRHLARAIDLLDPTQDRAGVSPEGASRRVKCVGCGE